MGIYDRDYMKRGEEGRGASSDSPGSLNDRLEQWSENLFTRHRKFLVGVVVGLILVVIVAFAALQLA